ncbi:N-acetylmannosamine kinase, partial [Escherichia coli]
LSALVSPLQAHAQRVAIASTGIIRDGSLLALNPHNLGGLLHFPLVKTLEQLTNLPTIAINDAQAAAWAEYQALEGDITDMVFITVSTGVGGGVVSGGKLLTGPGGLAGHIGHTLADPHGPVCGCGRTGCVEAIASGRGIAAAAQGELAGADARTIFTRAGQGDEQAQQLIHRSARTLARLIADIKATTDCQCVVVGGSVGLAEGYLALVETYLAQEPAAFHVDLLAAHYRHDAGLLGAALLAQGEKL